MSNIVITSTCNLGCPFCFASESRTKEEMDKRNMTREEFIKIAKFDDGFVTTICGGEPTIHPEFCEMVEDLLSIRFKNVLILTNGIWNNKVLNYFSTLPFAKKKRISFAFNILEPYLYKEEQLKKINSTLSIINPDFAIIAFTIYKHDFDYSYIIQLAKHYKIPNVRYSIAAPNITDKSTWRFDPKLDFKRLANLVYRFIMDAKKEGLHVIADCGYLPPCAYTKEELAELLLITDSLRFNCTSSPIDIGLEGNTWRCYGLYSALSTNINNFNNINKLREYFNRRSGLLNEITLYEECKTCEHKKSGLCGGGCLVFHILEKLKNNKSCCLFPIDDNEQLINSIPIINNQLLGICEDNNGITVYKKNVDKFSFKPKIEELEVDKALLEFIQLCDGKTKTHDIINKLLCKYSDASVTKEEVISHIQYLFNNDVLYFIYDSIC